MMAEWAKPEGGVWAWGGQPQGNPPSADKGVEGNDQGGAQGVEGSTIAYYQ